MLRVVDLLPSEQTVRTVRPQQVRAIDEQRLALPGDLPVSVLKVARTTHRHGVEVAGTGEMVVGLIGTPRGRQEPSEPVVRLGESGLLVDEAAEEPFGTGRVGRLQAAGGLEGASERLTTRLGRLRRQYGAARREIGLVARRHHQDRQGPDAIAVGDDVVEPPGEVGEQECVLIAGKGWVIDEFPGRVWRRWSADPVVLDGLVQQPAER